MLMLPSLTLPASVFSAPKLSLSICKQLLNTIRAEVVPAECEGGCSHASHWYTSAAPSLTPSGKIQTEEDSNSEAPALAPF